MTDTKKKAAPAKKAAKAKTNPAWDADRSHWFTSGAVPLYNADGTPANPTAKKLAAKKKSKK